MKLSVIIPAYNEKSVIRELIDKVKNVPLEKEIIVVDDFSLDGTREILKSINDERVKVLYHNKNEGKGACVRTGLKYATGDLVIIQDADLEYNPGDYPKLIKPILDKEASVVYGSRFLGSPRNSFGFLQFVANKFLTALTNFLYGARLTDMETCFKVFPIDLVRDLKIESNGFDLEVELTAKVLRRRISISEVPIFFKRRGYREGKKIAPRDGLVAIFKLLKYRLKKWL